MKIVVFGVAKKEGRVDVKSKFLITNRRKTGMEVANELIVMAVLMKNFPQLGVNLFIELVCPDIRVERGSFFHFRNLTMTCFRDE